MKRKSTCIFAVFIASILALQMSMCMSRVSAYEGVSREEEILAQMTMEEKISQMIIPAVRSWDGAELTDLSEAPELARALRKHQYGGVILFAMNIKEVGQTVRLIRDLQLNNAENTDVSVHIPYFMPVDEEGGAVLRLSFGTRMTGNMSIGAASENAEDNANMTGQVLGEEIAAVGFNVDYAPVVDVNNNPSNPVIGTRSFSDDPEVVSKLGLAYAEGLEENNIIPTFKHFPGHGDTDTDSHIGTPTVEKTYEQLKDTELAPFLFAVENGAEMIMTAHITYPLIDDEVTFPDGETKGVYPATMSKRIITDILRGDMGFDGVVVTDALEMDAIRTAGLVEGEQDSTEYRVNIAEKVINAGVDILLLPLDLNSQEAADSYDGYIEGLVKKVEEGAIPAERIDESVMRILELKGKYGILDAVPETDELEEAVEYARQVVGSAEHHDAEKKIADEAVTLLKNENDILPISKEKKNIVFLNRDEEDKVTIEYALRILKEQDLLDAVAQPYVDYYNVPSSPDNEPHYTEELSSKIKEADVVIGFSRTSNLKMLAEDSLQYLGIRKAIDDTHAADGAFILISDNLPYDAARYQDADAILLAYMGSGLGVDPTERESGSDNMKSINANILAAIETAFGGNDPVGKLPVNIPVIETNEDGTITVGSELLYERGYGLSYNAGTLPSSEQEENQRAEVYDVPQEVVDEAYDEAMMLADSEMSFWTMEALNYRLSAIMKYMSGIYPAENADMSEDLPENFLLSLDELIEETNSFLTGSDKDGGDAPDLSGYENAVAYWKKVQESISRNSGQNDGVEQNEDDGNEDEFFRLELESRIDLLEAALEVDNAVWEVLKSEFTGKFSWVADLEEELGLEVGDKVKKGTEVISGIIGLLDEVQVKIDVGFDEERYEKRIRMKNINTRYNLLQQALIVVCNVVMGKGTM